MREINNKEKSLLIDLLGAPAWQVVMEAADELCTQIKSNSSVRETDSETLKTTYINEGKVRGIREFIQELYSKIS